jgi:hypothetical protein
MVQYIVIREFFCGKFSPHGNNKKGLANPTKGFLRFFFFLPYLEGKKKGR